MTLDRLRQDCNGRVTSCLARQLLSKDELFKSSRDERVPSRYLRARTHLRDRQMAVQRRTSHGGYPSSRSMQREHWCVSNCVQPIQRDSTLACRCCYAAGERTSTVRPLRHGSAYTDLKLAVHHYARHTITLLVRDCNRAWSFMWIDSQGYRVTSTSGRN